MLPINTMPPMPMTDDFQTASRPNACQLLLIQWMEWAVHTPQGPHELREIALLRLRNCFNLLTDSLDLEDLNLTELPLQLPEHILDLKLKNNKLTHLPENLPKSLKRLDLGSNQLTQLRETLPNTLERLDLSCNQLMILPHDLPPSLEWLDVSYNQLTELPSLFPPSLKRLKVNYNCLTKFPDDLPSTLTRFSIAGNQLTNWPVQLPPFLERLDLSYNRIEQFLANLPPTLLSLDISFNRIKQLSEPLPGSLQRLRASGNLLTEILMLLPDSLEILDLSNNLLTQLPPRLPNCLEMLIVQNNQLTALYENPPPFLTIINAEGNPVNDSDQMTSKFMSSLHLWGSGYNRNQWMVICKEKNAAVFSDFLIELHQAMNTENSKLKQVIRDWLEELGKKNNAEIRQQTFAIAREGTESCVDRASYYFNQMHCLMIEHRLMKDGTSLPELFQALLGLFRLQELEKIAAVETEIRQQKSSGFTEAIEVHFAYQWYLRDELTLPIYTELQFGYLAKLTKDKITSAKKRVMEIEKECFILYLVNESDIWKHKLGEWNSKKLEEAKKHFLELMESIAFEGDKEQGYKITPKNETQRIEYSIFFPLTLEFLTEKNALFLLDGFNH